MDDELQRHLQLENDEDLAREVGYYVLRRMERVGFDALSRPEQVIGLSALAARYIRAHRAEFHQ